MIKKPLNCKILNDVKNTKPKTVEKFRELVRLIDYWNKHWLKGIVKNYTPRHIENYTTYSGDLSNEFEYVKKANEFKQIIIEKLKEVKQFKTLYLDKINKEVAEHVKNGETDKYIQFKIGDVFEAKSGKGSFKKMLEAGFASEVYNLKKGFTIPIYTSSAKKNHIVGYSNKENTMGTKVKGSFIKVNASGEAGRSVYVKKKAILCSKAYAFYGLLSDEFIALFFNGLLPSFARGTAQQNAYFNSYKNEILAIPANHAELSKQIELINNYEQYLKKIKEEIEDNTWNLIKRKEFEK